MTTYTIKDRTGEDYVEVGASGRSGVVFLDAHMKRVDTYMRFSVKQSKALRKALKAAEQEVLARG